MSTILINANNMVNIKASNTESQGNAKLESKENCFGKVFKNLTDQSKQTDDSNTSKVPQEKIKPLQNNQTTLLSAAIVQQPVNDNNDRNMGCLTSDTVEVSEQDASDDSITDPQLAVLPLDDNSQLVQEMIAVAVPNVITVTSSNDAIQAEIGQSVACLTENPVPVSNQTNAEILTAMSLETTGQSPTETELGAVPSVTSAISNDNTDSANIAATIVGNTVDQVLANNLPNEIPVNDGTAISAANIQNLSLKTVTTAQMNSAEQVAVSVSVSELLGQPSVQSTDLKNDLKTDIKSNKAIEIPLVAKFESKPVLQTANPVSEQIDGELVTTATDLTTPTTEPGKTSIDLSLLQTERVLNSTTKKDNNNILTQMTLIDVQKTGAFVKLQEQVAQSQTNPSVRKEEVFSQIIDQAKVMIDQNSSQMEISLRPDYLGKIQLKISVENQLVSAQFVAESDQVKALIESNLNDLKQMLHQNGVQVENLMVSVSQQDSGQNPADNPFYNNFQQNLAGTKKQESDDLFEAELDPFAKPDQTRTSNTQIDLMA